MKYLGITVRDDWSIKDHLERTAAKAGIIRNKLGRIMINKKGPTEKKRRLYQNVVNSVLLYGAPVRAEEVNENPRRAKEIRTVQRKMALRVIKAYRTVSQKMALFLARNPPIELQAEKLRAVYDRKKVAIEGTIKITDKGLSIIRKQEHERMIMKWRNKLIGKAGTGRGFSWEVVSCMKEWMGRIYGELTFQATQLVTAALRDTPIE